jgi:restriction endonuclease
VSPKRRVERNADTQARLARAESVADEVEAQKDRVDSQVSLADRLVKGWKRVHERNHLAELFHEEGRI